MITQLLLAVALFEPQPTTAATPEKVTVASVKGVNIAATWRDAGPGSPGVLLFPMCDRNAMDGWTPVAERLRSAGVSSLLIVYPGYPGAAPGPTASFYDEPAHADAALAWLRSRVGDTAAIGVAGSSCGVNHALRLVQRHPKVVRAAVAFAGPHQPAQLELIRNTPEFAVLSGSAQGNTPAPDWARELKTASANQASRLLLPEGSAHGTDVFAGQPNVAVEIADWLAAQLK